ncbi:hypothetical protein P3S68_003166 [Capsicum galapagoense]
MELIPDMPQEWEARDEGEGLGILAEQTTQMEPNYSDAVATAMLPMPDTSKEGVIGSDFKKHRESFET